MVVSTAIFAIDFLRSDNLGSDAVSMNLLILTVAGLNELGIDPEELQVLPFVLEVFLQTLEQGRQEPIRQSLDHVVSVNDEDWSGSLAQVAGFLLLIGFEGILVEIFLISDHNSLTNL